MTEQKQTAEQEPAYETKRDLGAYLDKVWEEIKEISRQVEQETRRGGRIAKLRLEIRGLSRDLGHKAADLGRIVYEAHLASDRRPTLSRVKGYDELVESIAALEAEVEIREAEITDLKTKPEEAEATVA